MSGDTSEIGIFPAAQDVQSGAYHPGESQMMNEPISDQILHQLLRDSAEQERELVEIRKKLDEFLWLFDNYNMRISGLEEEWKASRSDNK